MKNNEGNWQFKKSNLTFVYQGTFKNDNYEVDAERDSLAGWLHHLKGKVTIGHYNNLNDLKTLWIRCLGTEQMVRIIRKGKTISWTEEENINSHIRSQITDLKEIV